MYDELVKRLRNCAELHGECALCLYQGNGCDAMPETPLIQAADAIENLSKPRWIPVTERLPEGGTPVLVTYLGFHDHRPRANMLAYIDRDLGWCWWNDDIPDGAPCAVEITHWMPLPEPPKEE